MRKRKRTKKVWKKVFVVALSGAISVATVPVNTLAAQTSVEQVENESQLVNTGTKETEENTDEIPGETTKQSEQETQETERKGGGEQVTELSEKETAEQKAQMTENSQKETTEQEAQTTENFQEESTEQEAQTTENSQEETTVQEIQTGIEQEITEEKNDESQAQTQSESTDSIQTEKVISGTCGENLIWKLKNGVLSVTGRGEMDGYDVDLDGDAPWYEKKDSITSISIGEGVTLIGYGAFHGLSNVASVSIPNSVKEIGGYAFEGCSALTEVTISNSVTKIGKGTFKGCSALTELTIPDSVTWIGNDTFRNCDNLQSIKICNPDCKIYDSEWTISSRATIYCYENSEAQTYAQTYNRTFTAIGYCVRYHANGGENAPKRQLSDASSSIILSEEKPTRRGYDFVGWSEDKNGTTATYQPGEKLPLKKGMTLYAVWKLNGKCGENLTWELQNGVLSITGTGEMEDYDYCNDAPWYEEKDSITSISIGEGVTSIGDEAFQYLSNVTSVSISSSVTEIGEYAFEGCSALTSVSIPNSVTEIGEYAFYGCSALTSVNIPSSVTSIEYAAFEGCSALISVSIPNSVTRIGYSAFYGCSVLTSVSIPNSVTEIGEYAFYGCSALTSVNIPNSVTEIDEGAFEGCSALTLVSIPNSVTEIGYYAFEGCSALTSVNIPSSVTEIDEGAFKGCSALISVSIPNSVTRIGYSAFYMCDNLQTIKILNPDCKIYDSEYTISSSATIHGYEGSATQIYAQTYNRTFTAIGYCVRYHANGGENAPKRQLSDASNSIILSEEKPTRRGYDFVGWSEDKNGTTATYQPGEKLPPKKGMTLYAVWKSNGTCGENLTWDLKNGVLSIVGTGKMNDYDYWGEGDAPWYEEKDSITSISIGEGVTSIGDEAFQGLSNVTSVSISSSVTEIGEYAFEGCSALTSVSISSSVTEIGEYAFYGCSALTEVTIPNNVTRIGEYAFYGCSALTEVTIPNNVTRIGEYAFYGCSALTEVSIPSSVECVYRGSFWGCDNLQFIKICNPDCSIYSGESTISINATIYGYEGSTAQTYAQKYDRTFVSIGYFIRYYVNGGEHAPKSQLFDVSDSITLSEEKPTREGYDFVGWSEDKNSTTATYQSGETLSKKKGMALYAVWKSDGTCGKNLTWKLQNGVLSITGTGDMYEYEYYYDEDDVCNYDAEAPWYKEKDSITSISIGEGVTSVGDEAFQGLSNVTSVSIPNSVTKIGDSAFEECSALTSVSIPNSVTEIGKYAFRNCDNLQTIKILNPDCKIYGSETTISSSATIYGYEDSEAQTYAQEYDRTFVSIGYLVRYNANGGWSAPNVQAVDTLDSVTLSKEKPIKNGYDFVGWSEDKNSTTAMYQPGETLTQKKGVTLYAVWKLNGKCGENLTWELQGGVLSITGTGEMYEYKYKRWWVDDYNPLLDAPWYNKKDSITSISIGEGVTSIGNEAFQYLSNVTSVSISSSVTEIGEYAFEGCSALTSVSIPSSVTEIGDSAFGGCSALTSVSIPSSVTSIEYAAFEGCSALTSVSIPNSVTSIEYAAFRECSALTEVTIPNSVTIIEWNTFDNCNNLQSIKILNPECEICDDEDETTISATATIYGYEGSTAQQYANKYKRKFEVISEEAETYTITYDANGGTNAPNAQTKEQDKDITLSTTTPTRTGYTFQGWATSKNVAKAEYKAGATYSGNANVTLYAVWKANDYAISYELNGGTNSASNPANYTVETTTITLANATRDGYTFQGWYADKDFNTQVTTVEKGSTGNKTFYAKWKANEYKVTYDANGGTNAPEEETKEQDKDITLSTAIPTRTGYTFQGWATSKNATKAEYKAGATYSGNANVTLYAVWKVNDYAISYELNGGTNSTSNPANYTIETATITLANATRDGYTFQGWYTDKDFNTQVATVEKGSTGNKTFYAKWKANEYKVTYDANGGKGTMETLSCTYDASSQLTANAFTRKGYSFTGWNTNKDGSGKAYANKASIKNLTSTNNETITLYAQWKVKDYTITYNLNGGTNNADNPASYNITSDKITFQAPTRKGYTFVNWYKDASFKTKKTTIKSGSTGKVTLYAKWKANSYKVKFNKNGGKGTMKTLSCAYDTSKKLTANAFKRTGYTFVGWTKKKDGTGTVYKNKASIKNLTSTSGKTITLYAKWKANTYKVAFNKNAKAAKGTMKTISCTYDKTKKLTTNAFTRSGYKFAGWNTKANGKGKTYKNKASIKNLTSTNGKTITLYAQWKKK